LQVQIVPVGYSVVDLRVKRLHVVLIVARFQWTPLAPGGLGPSLLLWGPPTPVRAFLPKTGLSGSSASLSLRAVSSHPGESASCLQVSLHRRLQTSPSLAGWSPPHSVTRPNRVHFRYGSQVRLSGLRLGDCSFRRRVGYMLDTFLSCCSFFQFSREARLGLTHQRRKGKLTIGSSHDDLVRKCTWLPARRK
jgi:hypothetical protein